MGRFVDAIGAHQPPMLVAEIGASHVGDFTQALLLIEGAKDAGASACKFQCYEARDMTIDCAKLGFVMMGGKWRGRHLYELYEKAQTPLKWFPDLFQHAKELNLPIFSSVFSRRAIDLLERLDCPCYKIASFEIVDIPLIQYAASTGKPLIISTGMASRDEISEAVAATGSNKRILLACTSAYPTVLEETNFSLLQTKPFDALYGLSDHTLGHEAAVTAVALGGVLVEKHLCLSRSNGSEDAEFSLMPDEFRQMAKAVRSIWQAMQPSQSKSEDASRQARRSLYAVRDIGKGEMLTEDNVRSIRPAYGLPPKYLPAVIGRHAKRDIAYGTALSWDLIDG